MQRTLIFPSLKELNEFLAALNYNSITTDYNNISLTGKFELKDLELAEHTYHAVIIKSK